MCASTVTKTRIAEKMITRVGPTLIPGVSSSKKRINPAPPDGIGPSPRFLLFLAVFGIAFTSWDLSSLELGPLIKSSK